MVKNISSPLSIGPKKLVVGGLAKLVRDAGPFYAGEFVEVLLIKIKDKYEVESLITGTIATVPGNALIRIN